MTQETMKRFEMAWRAVIWCVLLGCLAFFTRESVADTGVGASVGGTAKNPTFNTVKTGDVTIQGTGKRILADFSNATISSRAMLQTSTANGSTVVAAIPNGSGTSGAIGAINSSNPTNGSTLFLSATATEGRIISGAFGSGSFLPIQMWVNNAARLTLATDGSATFTGPVSSEGLPVTTQSSGTFVGSFTTACATTPTANFKWLKVGSMVVLTMETDISCTSDSTAFALDAGSLPASIRPVANRCVFAGHGYSSSTVTTVAARVQTDGGVSLSNASTNCGTTLWSSSGTKMMSNFVITYSVL